MKKSIKKSIKTVTTMILAMSMLFTMGGCGSKEEATTAAEAVTEAATTAADAKTEAVTDADAKTEAGTEAKTDSSISGELTILAAASLTDVCGELKTMYEAEHSGVTLNFSFAGSGALQTQIEEGAPADLFISAAKKQMNTLKDEGLMKDDSICNLLENKVVLIVPADSTLGLTSFEDVKKDEVTMVGVGEIESVPAGQYAKTIFTNLGFWDAVEKKANFGTDVRTVLGWVETSAVSCGVVYATDAYGSDKVKIVAEAPAGSCDPVIYPAGIVKATKNADAAQSFLDFLKTDEAMKVFEKYGFVKATE